MKRIAFLLETRAYAEGFSVAALLAGFFAVLVVTFVLLYLFVI